MGKTYSHQGNREQWDAMQELRRSSAATAHRLRNREPRRAKHMGKGYESE